MLTPHDTTYEMAGPAPDEEPVTGGGAAAAAGDVAKVKLLDAAEVPAELAETTEKL